MAVTIQNVQPRSPAAAAKIRAGDVLVSIDGNDIFDGLDYEFYASGERLHLVVERAGKRRELTVEKDEYQPLGCEFASYLIDKQHHCHNACVFCFIDQLPKGLRPSLYFKDDDERLGFLFGNYITLTNLSERELNRMIEMRFSPVNISVHTTNPALRVQMMKNPKAGGALDVIPRLAKAGIELNFQLVLCPGINDGEELKRSLDDLSALYPATRSIAAVPVGLTRYRQGLPPLEAYTRQSAAAQLDIMLDAGEKLLAEGRPRLVYPSDEWFLLAGRPIPGADFYEGYPQLENGVGMWRVLLDEFTEALQALQDDEKKRRTEADIVVGTLAGPLFREIAALLRDAIPGAQLHVHAIENHFFGPGVTVTGLLTGQDVVAQLKGRLKSGRLLLPGDMLRAEGDMLLDDVTTQQLETALGVRVQLPGRGGDALLAAILDGED